MDAFGVTRQKARFSLSIFSGFVGLRVMQLSCRVVPMLEANYRFSACGALHGQFFCAVD